MILPVQEELRAHLARLLTALYSLDESSRPAIALEYPPNRELGDLGTPVAFELARRLRKAPRAIAQEIAEAFGSLDGVRRVAAAPNGYLNFFLERRDFLIERARIAEAAGVAHDRIAFDPGIGFGKLPEEDVTLIAGTGRLAAAGHPVLIGASRKSFIGRLTGIESARERAPASVWLAVEAARRGAAILRVHDVAATCQALAISAMMR